MDKINKLQEILKDMSNRMDKKILEIEEREKEEWGHGISLIGNEYWIRYEPPTVKIVYGNSTNLNDWGQVQYSSGWVSTWEGK